SAHSRQSNQASAPSSTGAPVVSRRYATPRNFSAASPPANRRASASWSAARTLMAKPCAARIRGCVSDPFSTHASTSGGSNETDATAFAVNPYGRPASISIAVTTATPVAKWPITRRSSLGSSAIPLAPARRPRPQVLLAVADRIQQPVPARIGQRERRRLRQEPAAHLVGQLDAPFARRHL